MSDLQSVAPLCLTVAGTAVNTTTLATCVTVGFQSKPAVQLWFTNTSNTVINVVRLPITINGQGTTTAGTAVYFTSIPAGGFKAYDYGSNKVRIPPCVWKAYVDGTPASGTFVVEYTAER